MYSPLQPLTHQGSKALESAVSLLGGNVETYRHVLRLYGPAEAVYAAFPREGGVQLSEQVFRRAGYGAVKNDGRVLLLSDAVIPSSDPVVNGKALAQGWPVFEIGASRAEWVPTSAIDALKMFDRALHPRNSPEQMAALRDSLQANGFDRPVTILYDPRSSRAVLDDGHHRLTIAQELGLGSMPVIVKVGGPVLNGREVQGPKAPGTDLLSPSDIGLPTHSDVRIDGFPGSSAFEPPAGLAPFSVELFYGKPAAIKWAKILTGQARLQIAGMDAEFSSRRPLLTTEEQMAYRDAREWLMGQIDAKWWLLHAGNVGELLTAFLRKISPGKPEPSAWDPAKAFAESPAATPTEQFDQWFAGSTVVDENGGPKGVYHGTHQPFDVFDFGRSASATLAKDAVVGFFFTDDLDVAAQYAGPNGFLGEFYLALKNPKVYGQTDPIDPYWEFKLDVAEWARIHRDPEIVSYYQCTSDDILGFRGNLVYQGFDGIVITGSHMDPILSDSGAHDYYIPFRPEQIKSVRNFGSWDAMNPNVMLSEPGDDWFSGSKVVDPKTKAPKTVYHGTTKAFDHFEQPKNPLEMVADKDARAHWAADRMLGTFFADDPKFADTFAGPEGLWREKVRRYPPGAQVYPVHLNIKRPYTVAPLEGSDETWLEAINRHAWDFVQAHPEEREAARDEFHRLRDAVPKDVASFDKLDAEDKAPAEMLVKRWRDSLVKQGYDGLRLVDPRADAKPNWSSWVAFDPSQAKTAWNHHPTKSPKLMMSEAPAHPDWPDHELVGHAVHDGVEYNLLRKGDQGVHHIKDLDSGETLGVTKGPFHVIEARHNSEVSMAAKMAGKVKLSDAANSDRLANLQRFMAGSHPGTLNSDGTPKVFYHATTGPYRSEPYPPVEDWVNKHWGDYPEPMTAQDHEVLAREYHRLVAHDAQYQAEPPFSVFRTPEDGGSAARAIWVTQDPEIMNDYSGMNSDPSPGMSPTESAERRNGRIYPLHINVKKPYIINDLGNEPHNLSIGHLKSLGYDGLRTADGKSWAAFSPTQVKSQFNQGSFNPGDPDIRLSEFADEEMPDRVFARFRPDDPTDDKSPSFGDYMGWLMPNGAFRDAGAGHERFLYGAFNEAGGKPPENVYASALKRGMMRLEIDKEGGKNAVLDVPIAQFGVMPTTAQIEKLRALTGPRAHKLEWEHSLRHPDGVGDDRVTATGTGLPNLEYHVKTNGQKPVTDVRTFLSEPLRDAETMYAEHLAKFRPDEVDNSSVWIGPSGRPYGLPPSPSQDRNASAIHGLAAREATGRSTEDLLAAGWARFRNGWNGGASSNVEFGPRPTPQLLRAVERQHGVKDGEGEFFWSRGDDSGHSIRSLRHYAKGNNFGMGINEDPGDVMLSDSGEFAELNAMADAEAQSRTTATPESPNHYGWLLPSGSFLHNKPKQTHDENAVEIMGMNLTDRAQAWNKAFQAGWIRVGQHGPTAHIQFPPGVTREQRAWIEQKMPPDTQWEDAKTRDYGDNLTEFGTYLGSGGRPQATDIRKFLSDGARRFSVGDVVRTPSGELEIHRGSRLVARAVGPSEHPNNGAWTMFNIFVNPRYRKQGAASAIYDFAERETGKKIQPSPPETLSDEAFEFWKRRDPAAVKNDVRHYRDQLLGKEITSKHFGGPFVIDYVGGAGVGGTRKGASSTLLFGRKSLQEAGLLPVELSASAVGDLPKFGEVLMNRDESFQAMADPGDRYGWLKPEGEFVSAERPGRPGVYDTHTSVAHRLLTGEYVRGYDDESSKSLDKALKMGWARIGRDGPSHAVEFHHTLTPKQMEWIDGSLRDGLSWEDTGDSAGSSSGYSLDELRAYVNHVKLPTNIRAFLSEDALRAWHADSHPATKDLDGNPMTFYHGSVKNIGNQFKVDGVSDQENMFGAGAYFTSDPHDASVNYANPEGPDHLNRIERAVDDAGWEGDKAHDRLFKKISKKYVQNEGNITPAYLHMKNPLVLTKDGTRFESNPPEDDEDGEYTGSGIDLMNAIREVAPEYNIDPEKVIEGAGLSDYMGGSISAQDFVDKLRENEDWGGAEDPYTGLTSNHWRDLFQRMGYDGVIADAYHLFGPRRVAGQYMVKGMPGLNEGTLHAVVWSPNQIKSPYNRGTYDPASPRIDMSEQAAMPYKVHPEFMDEQGHPRTLYHGTSRAFDRFNPARAGEATGADSAKRAFFFTDDPDVANNFARMASDNDIEKQWDAAVKTPESEALHNEWEKLFRDGDMKDPAVVARGHELLNEIHRRFPSTASVRDWDDRPKGLGAQIYPVHLIAQNPLVHDFGGSRHRDEPFGELMDRAKAQGHDSFVFKNVYDASDKPINVYGVFDPDHIKSKFNKGSWNLWDPRINMSEGSA